MTNQPQWKFLANLGDANPLDHGGYFVYEDETGDYPPEAEVLVIDNESEPAEAKLTYTVYRFALDKCTYVKGILSDNKYHPEHPAWWAGTEEERKNRPQETTCLKNLADQFDGMAVEDLAAKFCSDNPLDRAWAYREVGEYHGFENLDHDPFTLTRAEAEERYKEELGRSKSSRKEGGQ